MANLKLKEGIDIKPKVNTGLSDQGLNVLPQPGFTILYAGNITQSSSSGVITTNAPAGWYLCNGNLALISENPILFSILGTDFGGNGTTTFGLPDFTNRYAGSSSDVNAKTIAGSFKHSHTSVNVANPVNHTPVYSSHTHNSLDQINSQTWLHLHNHAANMGVSTTSGGGSTSGRRNQTGNFLATGGSHTHNSVGNSVTLNTNNSEHYHYESSANFNSQITRVFDGDLGLIHHQHPYSSTPTASFQESTDQNINSIRLNFIIRGG